VEEGGRQMEERKQQTKVFNYFFQAKVFPIPVAVSNG
jgi:hypothetical protein